MYETDIRAGDTVIIEDGDTAREHKVVGLNVPLPFTGGVTEIIIQNKKVLEIYPHDRVRKKNE